MEGEARHHYTNLIGMGGGVKLMYVTHKATDPFSAALMKVDDSQDSLALARHVIGAECPRSMFLGTTCKERDSVNTECFFKTTASTDITRAQFHRAAKHNKKYTYVYQNKVTTQTSVSCVHFLTGILLISAKQKTVA